MQREPNLTGEDSQRCVIYLLILSTLFKTHHLFGCIFKIVCLFFLLFCFQFPLLLLWAACVQKCDINKLIIIIIIYELNWDK